LFSAVALGQPIYFDGLYGDVANGQGLGKHSTIEYENGYLSWGTSFGNMKPYLLLVDTSGELLYDVYPDLPDSVSYQCGQIEQLSDSVFIGLCFRRETWVPSTEQGDYCLIRFKATGEIISEWVYGYSDRIDIPQHFIHTSDGGYHISGQTQYPQQSDGQLYAVKIDSMGTVQWEEEYGGSQYESGASGLQTPDGGFMLLGWTRSYGAGQRDFYLVKTDAQGNELWHETYGTNREEIGASIIRLHDGNYLLTGSGSHPSGSGSIAKVYKIDPEGNVIWAQTYTYQSNTGHNFHKTIETWNGDLVSVGMTNLLSNAGYLVKTDSLGEVIWQREYDKNENTDLFYSVLATDDGGFLLSGQAINETTNSQDAWLLKVDSIGCPYPNCTVGIDEQERTVLVDVWPNPCTDVLNIEAADRSATIEMTVTDMSGRAVTTPDPSLQRGEPLRMDVSCWPSGVYILKGMDEKGRSCSVKVVKQ